MVKPIRRPLQAKAVPYENDVMPVNLPLRQYEEPRDVAISQQGRRGLHSTSTGLSQ
jgi:hypothetical protein